jgi:hypothetical protein
MTQIAMIGEAHHGAVTYGYDPAIKACKQQALEVSFQGTQDSPVVEGLQESIIVSFVETQSLSAF